ncbi:MAG: amidohydrolase [Pontibacter sp.]|nr:amidohydrolase [Pontibacter sp.]
MQHTNLTDLPDLIALRRTLHQHPELSGIEQHTADLIVQQLKKYAPDEVYTAVGGTGVVAVFYGYQPEGPHVLFRAELDALPIPETNTDLAHLSVYERIGHKCGHDGHMTILMGLASLLQKHRLAKGKVILAFQPAEETGAGAFNMLQDERLLSLRPDFVFALHNLPGVPLHQVVVRNGAFAAASTGMVVELFGKESHAAEPENGNNPGVAMSEIILAFHQIISQKEHFRDLTLLTVIHARLGEVAFGTNPGFGTVMCTLRSFHPNDLQKLKELAQQTVSEIAARHGLAYKITYQEEFPATVNHPKQVWQVQQAAAKLQLNLQEAVHPFRWSEDFGHFTAAYKGALFGLGSGIEQPQLHHSDYDFPDELIPTGATLFYAIAQEILNK